MLEIGTAINEEQAKIIELDYAIQNIEGNIKNLEQNLAKISSIRQRLKPYLSEPIYECTHPRKMVVTSVSNMRDLAVGVLYECPDCGKRWRE
ncbi:MAG: hypothetical protein QXP32_06150 [Nitrososphaeria archaeon]